MKPSTLSFTWIQLPSCPSGADISVNAGRLERSRWRGGRFACDAPHVMPRGNASNLCSRTCSFSKYRKTNSLRMGEKIEFLWGVQRYVALTLIAKPATRNLQKAPHNLKADEV